MWTDKDGRSRFHDGEGMEAQLTFQQKIEHMSSSEANEQLRKEEEDDKEDRKLYVAAAINDYHVINKAMTLLSTDCGKNLAYDKLKEAEQIIVDSNARRFLETILEDRKTVTKDKNQKEPTEIYMNHREVTMTEDKQND